MSMPKNGTSNYSYNCVDFIWWGKKNPRTLKV